MFNSQSICNKLIELNILLNQTEADIVFISETWLKPALPDCCIANLEYWSIWRCDRVNRPGGGVCILTRNATVVASSVSVPCIDRPIDVQICTIDMHLKNCNVRLINVYRPPANDSCVTAVIAMKKLIRCLTDLCDCNLPIVLAGDLNLPNIDWRSPTLIADSESCSVNFSLFATRHAFDQLVSDPTRGRNILDIVLCNESFLIGTVKTCSPFSTSDHCCVRFNINYEDAAKQTSSHQSVASKRVAMPDFRRADWDSIKAHLSHVEWDSVFAQCCSCGDLATRFYDVLYESIEKHVPFTSCGSSHGTRVNMRHTAKVRKLERKKRELWRRLKQFNTPELVSKYRDSCRKYHTAIAAAQSQYENNLIESGNLGRFFRYAKSKFTGKKNVASLLCDNGQLAYEPTDKAMFYHH